jgi:hypothetical protein
MLSSLFSQLLALWMEKARQLNPKPAAPWIKEPRLQIHSKKENPYGGKHRRGTSEKNPTV